VTRAIRRGGATKGSAPTTRSRARAAWSSAMAAARAAAAAAEQRRSAALAVGEGVSAVEGPGPWVGSGRRHTEAGEGPPSSPPFTTWDRAGASRAAGEATAAVSGGAAAAGAEKEADITGHTWPYITGHTGPACQAAAAVATAAVETAPAGRTGRPWPGGGGGGRSTTCSKPGGGGGGAWVTKRPAAEAACASAIDAEEARALAEGAFASAEEEACAAATGRPRAPATDDPRSSGGCAWVGATCGRTVAGTAPAGLEGREGREERGGGGAGGWVPAMAAAGEAGKVILCIPPTLEGWVYSQLYLGLYMGYTQAILATRTYTLTVCNV
jgi:hypothetical protein